MFDSPSAPSAPSAPQGATGPGDVVDEAEAWARISGGAPLTALLDGQLGELRRLDSYGLVELAAAAERLSAWAAAVQAKVVQELDRRLSAEQISLSRGWMTPSAPSLTDIELAARLRTSRASAGYTVLFALALEQLPLTEAALAAGEITVAKAKILTRALGMTTAGVAAAVEREVLPRAATMTPRALRHEVARALHAYDPGAAAERAQVAQTERSVRLHPSGVDDGMAWLEAYLPTEAAAAIDGILARVARVARTDPTEHRTTDQLRADAFTATILDAWNSGSLPGSATPATQSTEGAPRRSVRRIRATDTAGLVHLTVSAATLLGADDDPGWIPGVGAVTAAVARALASDMRWVRILTDPASGTLLDHGTTTYTPPAALARHVRARDTRCVAPWCDRPAQACDLDHTTPYPSGATAAANLAPLCRRDHRIKHETPWQLTQPEPGQFVWSSPTGHRYARDPVPLMRPQPHGDVDAATRAAPEPDDSPPWEWLLSREPPWEADEEPRDLDDLVAA